MRRDVFQAIADPNRRAIIGFLAEKRMTLNEVSACFDVSRPAISKHVRILTECGLIIITQQGRERYCEVQMEPLQEVTKWAEQYRKFWNQKLDALDTFLTADAGEAKKKPKSLNHKTKKK